MDIWFRTNKSRQLAKLHRTKEWRSLSTDQRQLREDRVVEVLMEEKGRKLKELEKEWTRKVDEDDVDEEEYDNAYGIELHETNETRKQSESDWIDEDEVALEASLKGVLEVRKGTWNSLMERLEAEANENES